MEMTELIDEVKFKLTGDILDCELDDSGFIKVINAAFREVQRYIADTRLATLPYSPCMDLTGQGVSSVSRVFRSQGYLTGDVGRDGNSDPMYLAQWQMLSGGNNAFTMTDWVYNYGAWNTALQIRNTASTDLQFRFDKHTNYLYINCSFDKPDYITIEYVPRYNDVSEIVSDYWIDILVRMSVALTKVTLGRIRSRVTQSNALWTMDGETLLTEGNQELTELREQLRKASQLCYGID